MSIEEQSLRDLLVSAYANSCMQSVFEALRGGVEVKIEMIDGSVLTLRSVEEAELVLQERFGCNLKAIP